MKPQTSAVHPDLRQNLPPFTFNSKNLRLWRVVMNLRRTLKVPKDVRIENTFTPGQAGNTKIRLRIYRPIAMTSLSPALLWLHGGGYILGRPEMDDACCIQYARELGSVIVSVDYRHAPEHPFPAALNDSHAAWQWLAAQAGQLGIDARRMAIGGESAGGG
jgi:acetyl esterase/lipase